VTGVLGVTPATGWTAPWTGDVRSCTRRMATQDPRWDHLATVSSFRASWAATFPRDAPSTNNCRARARSSAGKGEGNPRADRALPQPFMANDTGTLGLAQQAVRARLAPPRYSNRLLTDAALGGEVQLSQPSCSLRPTEGGNRRGLTGLAFLGGDAKMRSCIRVSHLAACKCSCGSLPCFTCRTFCPRPRAPPRPPPTPQRPLMPSPVLMALHRNRRSRFPIYA